MKIEYNLKKVYGRLLQKVDQAFQKDKPLFSLAIYYPLHNYCGEDRTIDPFAENRQKQLVGLIRTQFLKRFESSAHAFACSCDRLLLKLLAFATVHSQSAPEKSRLDRWLRRHQDLTGYVHERQLELFGDEDNDEVDEDTSSPKRCSMPSPPCRARSTRSMKCWTRRTTISIRSLNFFTGR